MEFDVRPSKNVRYLVLFGSILVQFWFGLVETQTLGCTRYQVIIFWPMLSLLRLLAEYGGRHRFLDGPWMR